MEALDKLISVRHYCFVAGILNRGSFCESYRQAFRTVNRLYVELRDAREGQKPHTGRRATQRKRPVSRAA
jgi:hypothetical protein